MRDIDRGLHMQAAITALEWVATPIPGSPSRYIGALKAADTATRHAALSTGGGGGAPPKGTISDPTGAAAVRGMGDTDALRETHAIVIETAWCIRDDVTRAMYDCRIEHRAPTTAAMALTHLRWACTIPHSAGNAVAAYRRMGRFEEAEQLDTSIELICREATALGGMVAAQLARIVRSPKDVPTQKPMVGCTSCKRDAGAWEPVDPRHPKGELCRWCFDVLTEYGCRPTLPLVRMHRQGRRISTITMSRELNQPQKGKAK